MDGSHIEGSHKGWNSLQRAYASGIEVYTGLAHDFFLRRNICIASARIDEGRSVNCHDFIASAHGSHHVQLINHTAELFNLLYKKESSASKEKLKVYPVLPQVQIDETIGLVESAHSVTFGGFLEIKDEASPSDLDGSALLEDIDAEAEGMDQAQFIQSLNIDETLISVKMAQNPARVKALLTSTTSMISKPKTPSAVPTNSTNATNSIPSSESSRKRKGGLSESMADARKMMGIPSTDKTPDSKCR
jgi:hypothetical protein